MIDNIIEVLVYSTLFLVIVVGMMIYKNISKLSNIKGVWQVMVTPFNIPLISPYMNFNIERPLAKTIEEKGENGCLRISTMFGNYLIVTDRNMLKEFFITKANSI